MYLACFDTKKHFFRTRINILVVGIILVVLGIQSVTQIFNESIQDYKNINILTIVFLTLGPFLIIISFIYLDKQKEDYIQLNL